MLVERRQTLSDLPRATGISTRTMELIRSWGLEDEVRTAEIDVAWQGWVTGNLASGQGMAVPLGFPTRDQAAAVSPTAPADVAQDHLEPVLLDHLRSYASADVRFGQELVSVEQDGDGITAMLRSESGRTSTVRARYIVGTDGAHSTVRARTGIPMDGPDNLLENVTALFRAPLWDVVGTRRYGLYMITDPAAAGVFVPAGDRWLYGRVPGPDDGPQADSVEAMTERIRIGAGVTNLEPRIERIGRFSFAAQVARRYREGRVFLAGDAAHRITPRGATGMNTAIHDGYDLGWKLAWVVKGWASPELLDTYEAERRPIGVHNTALSADADGAGRRDDEALFADLGGRLPHVWVRGHGERRSTLDLIGPGLTLLIGADGPEWKGIASAIASPVPIDVHPVDELTAIVLGVRGRGARLVRPDGQTVALWPTGAVDPAPALAQAVRGLVGRGAAKRRERDSNPPRLEEPQRLSRRSRRIVHSLARPGTGPNRAG